MVKKEFIAGNTFIPVNTRHNGTYIDCKPFFVKNRGPTAPPLAKQMKKS